MKVPKEVKAVPWPEPWNASGKDGMPKLKMELHLPEVEGEPALVLDLINGSAVRIVGLKTQNRACIILPNGRQTKKNLKNVLYKQCGGIYGLYSIYPEISEIEDKMLRQWIGVKSSINHCLPELEKWIERRQEDERLEKADARGELRDEDVLDCPEGLPEGLEDYIRRVVLPEDETLVYNKGNVKGRCHLCGEEVKAPPGKRFRHQEWTVCPNCGEAVKCVLNRSNDFKALYVQNIIAPQLGDDGKTVFLRQWHLKRDSRARYDQVGEWLRWVKAGDKQKDKRGKTA